MSKPPNRMSQTNPLQPNGTPSPEDALHPSQFANRAGDVPSHLLVQIRAADHSITTVGMKVEPRLVIGRQDPGASFIPDLDLTPYGGKEAGVSRQHINIFHDGEHLYVQDNYSRNRTSHNNQMLDPSMPVALHDGDVLVLGRLPLTIYFVYS